MNIKEVKNDIISSISMVDTNKEKLEIIKDCYKDQDLVILLMGPSFNNYSKEQYLDLLKDKVVFCVKTTFNVAKFWKVYNDSKN